MAVNQGLLAGTANFSVDGVSYNLQGELKWSPGTVSRETLTGMDGVHGFKETPRAPSISATLRDSGGLTVADFNAMRGVNLVISLANGKIVIGSNMWTIEAQEVDSVEGTFEVKFEGALVEEA